MALDYRKCAEEIFSHLGGRDNIISAAHCATRLRLVIADNSKVDTKALEAEPITVAGSAAAALGLTFVFVLPAAVLIAGAVVVLLRRRR